jgi:hypothetical protein
MSVSRSAIAKWETDKYSFDHRTYISRRVPQLGHPFSYLIRQPIFWYHP